MEPKLKTYVITLSKNYMKGHPKAGQPTNFKEKFLNGEKIHTVRGNYSLWKKRIDEVVAGKAILSVREWKGIPYQEKQVVIKDLTSDHNVGIQKLDCDKPFAWEIDEVGLDVNDVTVLAKNDGLSYEDFDAWFDIENATGEKAIIHFTGFRY